MSIVCVGPKDESNEMECINMSKESIRQAAAGTYIHYACTYIRMYIVCMLRTFVCTFVYACLYIVHMYSVA